MHLAVTLLLKATLKSPVDDDDDDDDDDEIDDIHDAVIVNGIDRYSDISEPASPRAAATLDALAAAGVAEDAAATASRTSDTDESFVVIPETPRGTTPALGSSTVVADGPATVADPARDAIPASDLRLPLTQDELVIAIGTSRPEHIHRTVDFLLHFYQCALPRDLSHTR